MAKWIKNSSGGDKTWVGQLVSDGTYYEIQYQEEGLWANDTALLTDISSGDAIVAKDNSGTQDISDVNLAINHLKDIAPVDSNGIPIVKQEAFAHSSGFRTRFKGAINGVATKNTTTDIDYLISEERYINGVRLLLENHVGGDSIDFQIVDVDDILGYGAGTVLDMFGESWWVDQGLYTQPDVLVSYPAKIIAGLYIRIKYHSVGTQNDVTVRANLYLHKKI